LRQLQIDGVVEDPAGLEERVARELAEDDELDREDTEESTAREPRRGAAPGDRG